MAAPLGIGIIGAGFGASVQLPGFLSLPDARVIGVAATSEATSRALQEKHGLPKAFPSWHALAADPEIALVSVATPQREHESIVRECISRGKHVLCEKPFTLSSAAAKRLWEEAQAASIVHAIDFEFRELRAWQVLKERLDAGSVGTAKNADLRWIVGTWADPARTWRWQCDAAQGGGVLSALGVHLLDAAQWLLGPVAQVRGMAGTAITQRPDGQGGLRPVTSEDHADAEITAKNGATITITLSNIDPAGVGLAMRIEGTDGTLLLENTDKAYGAGYRVRENDVVIWEDPTPKPGIDARVPLFAALASRLLEAVRNGDTAFSPSFREGVRTQRLREAILASAADGGRPVDIQE